MASELGQACLRRQVKLVKVLLSRRRMHSVKGKRLDRDAFTGWMPLHCAAASGSVRVVRLILENGDVENIDDQDPLKGETALHLAARNGYVKICKLLLQCGADATVENKEGHSPLSSACDAGRSDAVEAILAADTSENHDLITCMGDASDWHFDESVNECLVRHQKEHKDAVYLKELASFLHR